MTRTSTLLESDISRDFGFFFYIHMGWRKIFFGAKSWSGGEGGAYMSAILDSGVKRRTT